MFSGPANAVRQEIALLNTYHAVEAFQEIEGFIKQHRGNERPLRRALLISDPLHFDEIEYFRYQLNRPGAFKPHELDYIRRWADTKTSLILSLTYNRAFPAVVGRNQPRIIRDNEDTISVVTFPGAGVLVEGQKVRDGKEEPVSRQVFTYGDLCQDPDALTDAMWDAVLSNPPLGKIKPPSVLK